MTKATETKVYTLQNGEIEVIYMGQDIPAGSVLWIAPPPVLQPVIIPTLTMRQARLALLNMTLLDDVEAAITTTENRIWWDYSTTVERSNPLVISVLTALGKTNTEIDAMFISAALI